MINVNDSSNRCKSIYWLHVEWPGKSTSNLETLKLQNHKNLRKPRNWENGEEKEKSASEIVARTRRVFTKSILRASQFRKEIDATRYEDVAQGVTKLLRCRHLSPPRKRSLERGWQGPVFLASRIRSGRRWPRTSVALHFCHAPIGRASSSRKWNAIKEPRRSERVSTSMKLLTEKYTREKERSGVSQRFRRRENDRTNDRTRRKKDRWKPQSLEIDFFGSFHTIAIERHFNRNSSVNLTRRSAMLL